MSDQTSVAEFLKLLVAILQQKEIKMPFQNDKPWQMLFYRLKKKHGNDVPFLRELQFDWDGPYPRSRDVNEFLHAMHWNATVGVVNPDFEWIVLPPDVADRWAGTQGNLDRSIRVLIDEAVADANDTFPKEKVPG